MMLRRYHKKQSDLPLTENEGIPMDTDFSRALSEYTLSELKVMCKERGLKGYSKMSEIELIELLEGAE